MKGSSQNWELRITEHEGGFTTERWKIFSLRHKVMNFDSQSQIQFFDALFIQVRYSDYLGFLF